MNPVVRSFLFITFLVRGHIPPCKLDLQFPSKWSTSNKLKLPLALYAQEFDAAKDVLYHGRAGDLLYTTHQLPKPSHKELQQALSQRGLPTHGNNRKLRAALTKALSQEACTSVLLPGEPPSATPADHDHDQEELSDDCSDVACGSHANDWDFDSDHDADAAYNYGDDSRLDDFC